MESKFSEKKFTLLNLMLLTKWNKTSDAGNKYVLTMTDAFTKYAEIVAIPNKEAVTVADAIFTKWICRYGDFFKVPSSC